MKRPLRLATKFLLTFAFLGTAQAGVSLLAGVAVVGGEKVDRFSETYDTLDDLIRKLAIQMGEACVQTEAFVFDSGRSLSRVMMLESSLDSFRWDYSELYADSEQVIFAAYGDYQTLLGSWYLLDDASFLAMCSV